MEKGKHYQLTGTNHFVWAKEMCEFDYITSRISNLTTDQARNLDRKDRPGYMVRFRGVEATVWIPQLVFKTMYSEVKSNNQSIMEQKTNLSFGQALEALKAGKKVCRIGWNDKNMWIALTPGSELPLHEARCGAVKARASELDTSTNQILTINILPHIDMKSATGEIVIGWLASQTDMLVNDWCILD